ncbi:MAG: hypothetical protein Q7S98_01095 [Deltaproteobacteria bacterium]|nr:hypothetical protein [Deltaproteobacteria bacterium]
MKRKKLFLGLLAISFLGCSAAKSPSENVARQFVEAYYLKIDLNAAIKVCDGLALEKIRQEIQLREGQSISPDTRQPKVSYKKVKELVEKEAGEALTEVYLFELTITPQDYASLKRISRVKVRQIGEDWKVIQFSDV